MYATSDKQAGSCCAAELQKQSTVGSKERRGNHGGEGWDNITGRAVREARHSSRQTHLFATRLISFFVLCLVIMVVCWRWPTARFGGVGLRQVVMIHGLVAW